MILFVSKRLSEHKNFTKLIDLFILATRKTFYTIDNDFIYKKVALDILSYLGLMKEQTDFVGYGSFLGLFNHLKDDYNIKFNNKKYTIPTLVEELKVSLENIIPFELIFLKNLSLITKSSDSNVLIIEENEKETQQLLSKLNSKTVLRLDLSDTNKDTESFESLLKLQQTTSIIPINVNFTEKKLAEVVVMLCSLINTESKNSVKIECSIERKDKVITKENVKCKAAGIGAGLLAQMEAVEQDVEAEVLLDEDEMI